MDSYQATTMVFSRIKTLDNENASKIMGYLLLQDNIDKEMIRLAFGPESLLHSLIFKAKTHLSLHSNTNNPPPFPHWPLSPNLDSASGSAFNLHGELFNEEGYEQIQDRFSFLDENSNADNLLDELHVRGFNSGFGSDDPIFGSGWRPCVYFARGFCKNGSGCRFVHGSSGGGSDVAGSAIVGSPSSNLCFSELEQNEQELLMRSPKPVVNSFPYNKWVNYLLQHQSDNHRSALTMGDHDLHKFGRFRHDFSAMNSPNSRQIYLTFPADSDFKEEDVSNHFSIYGPVQDVRIPYQQKRMFGFVTFVYAETVKLILAKGNPHFVCDSRVLVKPYKEKGKFSDKNQHLERTEYSPFPSPPSIDPRERFDLHLGGRMVHNSHQEMLLRRKFEEQAELQQAIELEGKRLINLQLPDFKNHHHYSHHSNGFSSWSPIQSPTLSKTPNNQILFPPPDNVVNLQMPKENGGCPKGAAGDDANAVKQQELESIPACNGNNGCEELPKSEEIDLHECLEQFLPDSLFASPKKSAGDCFSAFSTCLPEVEDKSTAPIASSPYNYTLHHVFTKCPGHLQGMDRLTLIWLVVVLVFTASF